MSHRCILTSACHGCEDEGTVTIVSRLIFCRVVQLFQLSVIGDPPRDGLLRRVVTPLRLNVLGLSQGPKGLTGFTAPNLCSTFSPFFPLTETFLHEWSRRTCRKCTGQLVLFFGRISCTVEQQATQTKPNRNKTQNNETKKDIQLCTCNGEINGETADNLDFIGQ